MDSRLLKRSVGASSLLETVMAMTILLFILTMGLLLIDQVNGSINPRSLYKAHQICRSVKSNDMEWRKGENLIDIDGYTVRCLVENVSPKLKNIQIDILDARDKCIYTMRYYENDDSLPGK